MTSLAPREARWRAMARPIPREAPVTMATRSWRGRHGLVGVGMALALLPISEAIKVKTRKRFRKGKCCGSWEILWAR